MFVASGTPEGELKEVAVLRGVSEYFSELHGSPRTKQDIALDILARHKLEASEVAFIGDAESDLIAATATQLRFVARVSAGGDQRFVGHLQIHDLTELEKILKRME
jgi:phosphoglycolate phosphatase-like HAD superfamily hydrolase